MVKYYCKLFDPNMDEQLNRIIYAGESLSSKFSNFTIKVDLNDFDISHLDISEYKINVEKKVDWRYSSYNSYVGQIDNIQKQVLFEGKLDETKGDNVYYRFSLEFFTGGISVFDGSKYSFEIILKDKCEDYTINVDNSLVIGDCFELQETKEVNDITFNVEVKKSNDYNALMYWYDFSYEENVKPKEFKIFGTNKKSFNYVVAKPIFKNDFTYLHFYMKDNFDNVRYKKVKIITKENVNELMEIISGDVYVNQLSDPIHIFYNEKNINEVKIKLTTVKINGEEESYIGKQVIGLKPIKNNLINFKLNEHFDNIEEIFKMSKSVQLSFTLNSAEKESLNRISIFYDSTAPEIFLNIKNNYLLSDKKVDYIDITGQVVDKNLFYIGNDVKKYDFEKIENYAIINSVKRITDIVLNNSKHVKPVMFGNYYIAKIDDAIKEIYNETNKLEDVVYLDDFCSENSKIFFVNISKNALNTYEQNLLNSNKIILKGEITSVITKQSTYDIGDSYVIKAEVPIETTNNVSFDIGVNEFDYSFLKKINHKSLSCELNSDKTINLDFDKTRLIVIKSNKDIELKKFDTTKELSTKTNMRIDDISFATISLKKNSFFTCKQSHIFFDDLLNEKQTSNIYVNPKILSGENNVEFKNYKMTMVESEIFSFELKVKVNCGINKLKISFEDILKNVAEKEFVIEVQDKDIEISIDETELNDAIITEKDNIKLLNTSKETLSLKLIIKNQTFLQTKEEKYIVVVSEKGNSRYKIINDESGLSYCYVDVHADKSLCNIFYDNVNTKSKLSLLLNKLDNLTLEVEKEIITGVSKYHIPIKKDIFSVVTLEHTNLDKITCEYVEINKETFIEVKRVDDKSFIEESHITIKAHDNKNIFEPISKSVDITFYNDALIADSYIQPKFLINNNIVSNYINIEIKTFEKEHIESIVYYDMLELDFYKRKKTARSIGNDIYLLEDIITPIKESYIDVEITLKTKKPIIITKRLFNNKQIFLPLNEDNISVAYERTSDFLNIIFKNKNKESVKIKKMSIFSGSKEIVKIDSFIMEPLKLKKIEVDYKLIVDFDKINIKLENEYGKIISFADYYLKTRRKRTYSNLEGFNDFNVITSDNSMYVKLNKEKENEELKLVIKDIFGSTKEYNLINGTNIINKLQEGIYEYFLIDKSDDHIVGKYHVEICDNVNDKIQIKNTSYSKYEFIKELIIENLTSIPIDQCNPSILYYLNDSLIKMYHPYKIEERKIYFNIDKKYGVNKYVYKDDFLETELGKVIISSEKTQDAYIYDFTTHDESAFYVVENNITLESRAPFYFKSHNLKYMKIFSKTINRWFTKTIVDGQENMIPFAFIPCTVKFFDFNNKEVKEIEKEFKLIKGE